MLEQLTKQLQDKRHLEESDVAAAVAALISDTLPVQSKVDFLCALATKGETTGEIGSFAMEMRKLSIKPPLSPEVQKQEILDVCGTGGDQLNTFNISTTVALVAASAGVIMAKHGNRAITSKSGSADVLAALGIPIELTPEQAAQSLKEHGFAFFLASRFHPAFKNIIPARKACSDMGQRTIFNFLGPLLNPASPTCQLMGVAKPELCEPSARVLQQVGVRRAMVVSGSTDRGYLDELSISGDSVIAEFYQDRGFNVSTLSPGDVGLTGGTLNDLKGGDAQENAAILLGIIKGEDKGPKREAVLFNAGAALMVAGRAKSIMEGMALAGDCIDSGATFKKVRELSSRTDL